MKTSVRTCLKPCTSLLQTETSLPAASPAPPSPPPRPPSPPWRSWGSSPPYDGARSSPSPRQQREEREHNLIMLKLNSGAWQSYEFSFFNLIMLTRYQALWFCYLHLFIKLYFHLHTQLISTERWESFQRWIPDEK